MVVIMKCAKCNRTIGKAAKYYESGRGERFHVGCVTKRTNPPPVLDLSVGPTRAKVDPEVQRTPKTAALTVQRIFPKATLSNPRPPKKWFERTVRGVRRSKSAESPEAVAGSLWTKKSPRQRAAIRKAEGRRPRKVRKVRKNPERAGLIIDLALKALRVAKNTGNEALELCNRGQYDSADHTNNVAKQWYYRAEGLIDSLKKEEAARYYLADEKRRAFFPIGQVNEILGEGTMRQPVKFDNPRRRRSGRGRKAQKNPMSADSIIASIEEEWRAAEQGADHARTHLAYRPPRINLAWGAVEAAEQHYNRASGFLWSLTPAERDQLLQRGTVVFRKLRGAADELWRVAKVVPKGKNPGGRRSGRKVRRNPHDAETIKQSTKILYQQAEEKYRDAWSFARSKDHQAAALRLAEADKLFHLARGGMWALDGRIPAELAALRSLDTVKNNCIELRKEAMREGAASPLPNPASVEDYPYDGWSPKTNKTASGWIERQIKVPEDEANRIMQRAEAAGLDVGTDADYDDPTGENMTVIIRGPRAKVEKIRPARSNPKKKNPTDADFKRQVRQAEKTRPATDVLGRKLTYRKLTKFSPARSGSDVVEKMPCRYCGAETFHDVVYYTRPMRPNRHVKVVRCMYHAPADWEGRRAEDPFKYVSHVPESAEYKGAQPPQVPPAGMRTPPPAWSARDPYQGQATLDRFGQQTLTGYPNPPDSRLPENRYPWRKVRGKTMRLHRAIMEKIIGRPLRESEHVHHKNGNKQDNRPANLQVMSAREHARTPKGPRAKVRKNPAPSKRALKRFWTFHGLQPRAAERVKVPPLPAELVQLGEVLELTYGCDKVHGVEGLKSPRREYRLFSHDFDRPPMLATDPDGRRLYVVGKVKVTERGIEG